MSDSDEEHLKSQFFFNYASNINSMVYQAKNRTLTAKEIDETQNKIIQALEQENEWEIRK